MEWAEGGSQCHPARFFAPPQVSSSLPQNASSERELYIGFQPTPSLRFSDKLVRRVLPIFFSIMLLYFLRTPCLTLTLFFIPKAFDDAVHGVKIKQIRRAAEAPEFLEILTLKFPQSSRLFSVHLLDAWVFSPMASSSS